ncbi:TetR/AcrR family transcriptional regulator [Nocardia panacis]|uniref:TetR/AcrR family transcriptional regulator n=1 Tax=Nocardia panacis TaxID=2340916 RepID=A0A3A4KL27_9NOCA|nr:TetR/AcrR family transcriptional regulator [Nocardia panacis]RJO73687.1 TetR/AcrR family transcriptional regulator [Nocardia panacis]
MGDARTERWADNRVRMRRKLIDAAIQVIETEGPQASMRAIAAAAEVSKPTLYRFFADKAELTLAISNRAKQDIAAGLAQVRTHPEGSPAAILNSALTGYAALIVEHPHIARFLFQGTENPAARTLENWRAVRVEVADLITLLVGSPSATPEFDADFYASMVVGAVKGAANWWHRTADHADSAEEFVRRMEPVVHAIVAGAAADAGVTIDFDKPLTITVP